MSLFKNYRRSDPILALGPHAAYLPNRGQIVSGGKLTQWQDQTGNGYHATQSDTAKQPAWSVSSADFLGNPSVSFDGSDDYLSAAIGTITTPWTIVAVGTWDNNNATGPFIAGGNTTSYGLRHQNSAPTVNSGVNNNMDVPAPATGTPFIFVGQGGVSGNDVGHFRTRDVTNDETMSGAGSGALGGLTIGGLGAGVASWGGELTALLVFDRPLTQTEVDLISDYAAANWVDVEPILLWDLDVDNATLNGSGAATLVPDSSSNGYDFGLGVAVPTIANDPDFNGFRSLDPSANSQHLANLSVPIPPTWTLFFVATYVNSSGGLVRLNTSNPSVFYGVIRLTSTGTLSIMDEAGGTLAAPVPPSGPLVGMAIFAGGGLSELHVHSDGQTPTVTTGTLTATTAGTGAWIMTNQSLSSKWEGEATRFIKYQGALRPDVYDPIVAALKTKYGITTI